MEMDRLRRAAAANLGALRSGEVARRLEAERAARKRAKDADRANAAIERTMARERKAEIKRLRERLHEIKGIEHCVEVDFPADMQRGAMEELDAERDRICERIYRLERR